MNDEPQLGRWGFAEPGPLRDKLTGLALAGAKTATAGLLREYEADGSALPEVGERSLLVDSEEKPVALVETLDVRVVRLVDVDDRHAIDEGEGYANAAEFRVSHEQYWNGHLDKLREQLGDAEFALADDTFVVLERFRVVERFTTHEPADLRELPGEEASWQRLHALMSRLTPDLADIPGYFQEGWTAKDAIAHLGTWMAEGARMLRQIAVGTYREGELDVDAENARFLAAMRGIPLDTIHLQAASARSQLLSAWRVLSELTPAATFWVRKAGPEHMAEHLPRLEAWVEELARRR
jgi:uncharacterized protein YhfF